MWIRVMKYRAISAGPICRAYVGPKKRRVLRTMLTAGTGALGTSVPLSAMAIVRLSRCSAAVVYPFLDHLLLAGWVIDPLIEIPSRHAYDPRVPQSSVRMFSLTSAGRNGALKLLQ